MSETVADTEAAPETGPGPATPGPVDRRRRRGRRSTAPLVGLLVIGLGLALAPAIFQMFYARPPGRRHDRPVPAVDDEGRGHEAPRVSSTEIRAAVRRDAGPVDPVAAAKLGLTPNAYESGSRS